MRGRAFHLARGWGRRTAPTQGDAAGWPAGWCVGPPEAGTSSCRPHLLPPPPPPVAGHCQISCGRCGCCPTFAAAVKQTGQLGELLWALNITGLKANAERPGYMATLLAPGDGAFKAFYDANGGRAPLVIGWSCFCSLGVPRMAAARFHPDVHWPLSTLPPSACTTYPQA